MLTHQTWARAGKSGLGKSTFINTLFSSHLVDTTPLTAAQLTKSTAEIHTTSHFLEENKIRLRVAITDTPGYGDQINNDHCWDPIVRYIKEQHAIYLRKELTPQRERNIPDTRVHAVLFFLSPHSGTLSPLDVTVMRKVSEVANVIPVVSKADCLLPEELGALKKRIQSELQTFGIRFFPFMDQPMDALPEAERQEMQSHLKVREHMPFAVVGSEKNVVMEGKAVRGRRTKWGIINGGSIVCFLGKWPH
jgi:septin 3/9/12